MRSRPGSRACGARASPASVALGPGENARRWQFALSPRQGGAKTRRKHEVARHVLACLPAGVSSPRMPAVRLRERLSPALRSCGLRWSAASSIHCDSVLGRGRSSAAAWPGVCAATQPGSAFGSVVCFLVFFCLSYAGLALAPRLAGCAGASWASRCACFLGSSCRR